MLLRSDDVEVALADQPIRDIDLLLSFLLLSLLSDDFPQLFLLDFRLLLEVLFDDFINAVRRESFSRRGNRRAFLSRRRMITYWT